jgi:hypothetical protein
MSLGIIDSTVLTDIADAIRDTFGTTKTYKPTQMANAIRTQGKPLYSFSDATDEELTEMVNAYYSGDITLDEVKSVWAVGDKRVIHINAIEEKINNDEDEGDADYKEGDYNFIIIGFNQGYINSNQNALVTLWQENSYYGPMNNNTDNPYGAYWQSDYGSESSSRRTWCNNSYYNALPSYIQSLIKTTSNPVCWWDSMSRDDGAWNTSKASDKCFILSCEEYLGLGDYNDVNNDNYCEDQTYYAEGSQYEYFKNTTNTIDSWCWTRSIASKNIHPNYKKIPDWGIQVKPAKNVYDTNSNIIDNSNINPAFCI